MADKTKTLTLHHLNNSQSQRILWLLEELSIPYNLELHTRNPTTHLAPSSLSALGPTGKAPLLVTSSGQNIPESSAIATYLIRTYDTDDKFGLRNGDWVRDEILLSMMISNLGPANRMMLMLDFNAIGKGKEPWGKRVGAPGIRQVLGSLEKELGNGPYFMGAEPGRCDIMFEFLLAMISQRGWVDLPKEFPSLNAWQERVYARPAWKRGIEKGNGYDLTSFPQNPHLEVA